MHYKLRYSFDFVQIKECSSTSIKYVWGGEWFAVKQLSCRKTNSVFKRLKKLVVPYNSQFEFASHSVILMARCFVFLYPPSGCSHLQLKILGSESFARWLVPLALLLEIELALVLEIPHQSVIWLIPYHHISQSFDLPTSASASSISSSSASTSPTTSVSHLTCPLVLALAVGS